MNRPRGSSDRPAEGDCQEAMRELYGYLDGELTVERRALIARHLDDCTPCVEAYDFEVELRHVVAAKCRERVPDSLRRRIAESLGLPAEPGDGQ